MPDIKLSARSGLEHLAVPGRIGGSHGEPSVTLALRSGVAIASVMARNGQQEHLAHRVRDAFGLKLPASPRRHVAGATAWVWAGPGLWLATAEGVAGQGLERRLRDELAGLASVCDQSDLHTLIRVTGARARETLAKGLMIDLHPHVFGSGDVALTAFGHIGVHFWQLDPTPSYEFAVFRSLAADFWRGVVNAGSEFGVVIKPNS
jgi:heterotetrameric sarcosine oxidase gamma subunit